MLLYVIRSLSLAAVCLLTHAFVQISCMSGRSSTKGDILRCSIPRQVHASNRQPTSSKLSDMLPLSLHIRLYCHISRVSDGSPNGAMSSCVLSLGDPNPLGLWPGAVIF